MANATNIRLWIVINQNYPFACRLLHSLLFGVMITLASKAWLNKNLCQCLFLCLCQQPPSHFRSVSPLPSFFPLTPLSPSLDTHTHSHTHPSSSPSALPTLCGHRAQRQAAWAGRGAPGRAPGSLERNSGGKLEREKMRLWIKRGRRVKSRRGWREGRWGEARNRAQRGWRDKRMQKQGRHATEERITEEGGDKRRLEK